MSRKREREKALFAAFLEVAPEFAGEPLAEWHQPNDERDFPDINPKVQNAQYLGLVSIVVRDYDEALAFYVGKLGFSLIEDTYQPAQDKR